MTIIKVQNQTLWRRLPASAVYGVVFTILANAILKESKMSGINLEMKRTNYLYFQIIEPYVCIKKTKFS